VARVDVELFSEHFLGKTRAGSQAGEVSAESDTEIFGKRFHALDGAPNLFVSKDYGHTTAWCVLCSISFFQKMRLLIVADDESVRRALACVVRYLGWESQACGPDADTIAALMVNSGIDAVLLDHRMWGIDGLEIAKSLRDRDITVPMVLMSPIIDSIRHEVLTSLQISKVVSKPPSLDELRAALGEVARASAVVTD
jgi:CheY-like chemotaxis protein